MRHVPRFVDAFDALVPGQGRAIVMNADPAGLLACLQKERKGQFEWTPLPAEPGTWSVEITRRAAERGAPRTVNDALSWDHDRLDGLDAAVFAARKVGDFARASGLFSNFAFGLRRHIRFEEELLFPEFEAKAGLPSENGPTAVMRDEHRDILGILSRMESAVGEDSPRAESLRHALVGVLGNHNLKEENIVYPMTDRALSAEERDGLVARIQAL